LPEFFQTQCPIVITTASSVLCELGIVEERCAAEKPNRLVSGPHHMADNPVHGIASRLRGEKTLLMIDTGEIPIQHERTDLELKRKHLWIHHFLLVRRFR
jgi:hypothetical protein